MIVTISSSARNNPMTSAGCTQESKIARLNSVGATTAAPHAGKRDEATDGEDGAPQERVGHTQGDQAEAKGGPQRHVDGQHHAEKPTDARARLVERTRGQGEAPRADDTQKTVPQLLAL